MKVSIPVKLCNNAYAEKHKDGHNFSESTKQSTIGINDNLRVNGEHAVAACENGKNERRSRRARKERKGKEKGNNCAVGK